MIRVSRPGKNVVIEFIPRVEKFAKLALEPAKAKEVAAALVAAAEGRLEPGQTIPFDADIVVE